MTKAKWLNLMARLGLVENLATFEELDRCYSEPHRHYHNKQHIDSMLCLLQDAKELSEQYDLVELAIWFHDAIYKVFSSTNELDSANWASAFLAQNNVDAAIQNTVHSLVMATKHDVSLSNSDEKLIVDIDLAILGRDTDLYEQFEMWVRKEYSVVPKFIFNAKRKQILQEFLQRTRIFHHDFFFERFEQNARENLKHAIARL